MGFGDVQMNGIQAESGRLQNADGDITLFGCDMQNIKCKADYGDVELKSGTWENGSITLEDGDAKIQNTKLSGDVSVENSYGDIELELGKRSGTAGNYGKDRFWGDRCTGYHGESDAERGGRAELFLCTGSASGQNHTDDKGW